MTVAVVTGGGGGIGRAIALRLARDGADIAIVDIDAGRGNETAELVETEGRRALFVRADVSNEAEVAGYVDTVERRLGAIGMFANNAGVEGVLAPIFDYPEAAFDRCLAINVKGMFLGLKHVLRRMRERGTGAVVNTASTSAIRGRAGLAGYVSTKHAVLGLTRVAALDMAGTRVRVNAILPGPIETRMIRSLDEQARRGGGAIKRALDVSYGKPEDVAGVVAFLLSDQAILVHGAAWTVDAGSTVA